jgi:quinol monooxygenase YgiN
MELPVTVIAHVRAKPEKQSLVAQELKKLIAPTRQEPGCLQYELLQDLKDPNQFVFHEQWSTLEQHQAHLDSAHIAAFVTACKGAIAEATIHPLKPLDMTQE